MMSEARERELWVARDDDGLYRFFFGGEPEYDPDTGTHHESHEPPGAIASIGGDMHDAEANAMGITLHPGERALIAFCRHTRPLQGNYIHEVGERELA
jgi:hypothetical protein